MIYLHLNLPKKRDVQKRFIEYTQSNLNNDTKINELIDWENKRENVKLGSTVFKGENKFRPAEEKCAYLKFFMLPVKL